MTYRVKQLNIRDANCDGEDELLIADYVISQQVAFRIAKDWHKLHNTTVVIYDEFGHLSQCLSPYDFEVIVSDYVIRTETSYMMVVVYANLLRDAGTRDVEIRLSNDSNYVLKKF